MSERDAGAAGDSFASSRHCFEAVLGFLEGEEACGFEHGELEEHLERQSRELFRRLFQDHLVIRSQREERLEEVLDANAVPRPSVETGHHRTLATVFGEVDVERLAYRRRGHENLHLADALLNLPAEKHSHGLRRWAAIEGARGSFDAAVEAIERATGQQVGKRQVESLAQRAAVDVDAFYAQRSGRQTNPEDVLVISVDGKGIVMRPDALRAGTRRASEASTTKLKARLSKGEKRGRKRMAELGAVYDLTPVSRPATDVLASKDQEPVKAPVAKNKWLTASVVEDAAEVIGEVFDEAERRDPQHLRTWVALVDGNRHQIDRIQAEAKHRDLNVTILIDLIHVLEYLWKAAWCFFAEGDTAAEDWVRDRALAVLDGATGNVAAGIRRRATSQHLSPLQRHGADTCADYLTNKAAHLDYPTALAAGWPIATGIIEGACRHIVKDRMDLTGARWSLDGAEAILKLRALRSNGDFDAYWRFHQSREQQRIHRSRYADNVIPRAA
jgi:hypothetical protein